jgi:hypothetical protein
LKIIQQKHAEYKVFGLFHALRKLIYTTIYKRLTDPVMADYAYAKSSYRYFERFYKNHNAEFSFSKPSNDIGENEPVYWTCWLQGIEQAPDIVKACVHSAQKYAAGRRIIVITYENLETYAALPDFILEKHRQGHIPAAHFTDMLRIYLLYMYGGVWFDATVFFTQKIPTELFAEPVFFFRDPFREISPVSNWFIIAGRGNLLIYKLLCALCTYWRTKNTLIDYFMFHYLLKVIIQNDSQCAQIFGDMAYRNSQNPHYMQFELLSAEFDAAKWEKAKGVSFCHKLTWKIPSEKIAKNNSFFHYIAGSVPVL